jgi:hypothetical protein
MRRNNGTFPCLKKIVQAQGKGKIVLREKAIAAALHFMMMLFFINCLIMEYT